MLIKELGVVKLHESKFDLKSWRFRVSRHLSVSDLLSELWQFFLVCPPNQYSLRSVKYLRLLVNMSKFGEKVTFVCCEPA